MSAHEINGSGRSSRAWKVIRVVGWVLGFLLAVGQVSWFLGTGWVGHCAEKGDVIGQPIGCLLRAVPGAFFAGLGAMTLLVIRDDGSRRTRIVLVAGAVLVMLGFATATAWSGLD